MRCPAAYGAALTLFLAPVALGAASLSDLQPAFGGLLMRAFSFSASDVADLERGQVVTHGLAATTIGEVAVVGAVRVNAPRDAFVARYRDIVHFKRGDGVLQIGRFSEPPTLEDLAPMTVAKEDLDVRTCRVSRCDIRLPAEAIGRFQREIDWKDRDAQARAAALFKQILFEHVRAFVSGGSGRIVQYDDEKRPVRPADDFAGLLEHSPYVDEVAPGLSEHLQGFPLRGMRDAEDFLYWSKERFGFAPFITVTEVTIMPPAATSTVIASRDVYSSRYLNASLTVTIASDAVSTPGAFYLVYVNRSRADALKGSFAGMRRLLVEQRAKSDLDVNLKAIKRRLEQNP